MSFFKKIISYFREEIEIIEEEEWQKKQDHALMIEAPHEAPRAEEKTLLTAPERKQDKTARPSHAFLPLEPAISARVAYKYPTRRNETVTVRAVRTRGTEQDEPETDSRPRVPVEKKIERIPEKRVAPRPFRPTEIPSPIYGFRDRPAKDGQVRENAGQQEPFVPPTIVKVEKKTPSLTVVPDRKQEEESKKPTPLELVKEARKQEEAQSVPVSAPQESYEQEKEEKAPPRTRRHSPFNVVMLKQDREKLTQPQEPAAAVQEAVPETASVPAPVNTPDDAQLLLEPSQWSMPLSFLTPPAAQTRDEQWIEAKTAVLTETLASFNIQADVTGVTVGPAITRFEVTPSVGVKVSKIVSLQDDIKRSLAARTIRIEAPIPGTQVVGIEVPNENSRPVFLSEIIQHESFQSSDSPLAAALGLDIAGEPVVLDLKKMPHGLIAGATGSGKSVCINSILISLLYKAAPHEVKLLLIDPKMVELTPYNGIPHLASPVITDVKAATAALKWAVEEMERRYQLFVHAGVRDISSFNEKGKQSEQKVPHLPYLVIVIDELADLMMMAPSEVEESIARLAQKARACGIHLIVATQRPSVDVITGLIKANIPTRVAFSVSSQIDSRTILDKIGAEKLLGKGDMLFLNNGASESVRLQGTFVTNDEIDRAVQYAREQQQPDYVLKPDELTQKAAVQQEEDELFFEACELAVRQGGASTSMLQRQLKVGYNRAARLIEMMEEQGIVSGQRAGKPREVLITESDLPPMLEQ